MSNAILFHLKYYKLNFNKFSTILFRNMSKEVKSSIDYDEKWYTRGKKAENVPEGILKGILDRFDGITIDSSIEKLEKSSFITTLSKSLNYWIENNRRCIWFRVYMDEIDWVPVLAKNGFNFHHAKKQFVMMYKWLPENELEGLPKYAHHQIGVGAVVINNENQILVVSEKNALIANSWKLPGGYVEPSEDFVCAAIREVLEETNIETKFDSLISLRHAHLAAFGCSDLYIVISLIPTTKNNIKKCDREIEKCKWMDIEEYVNHPNVHELNRNFLRTYLYYKEKGIKIIREEEVHQILKKKYCIYKMQATATEDSSTMNST